MVGFHNFTFEVIDTSPLGQTSVILPFVVEVIKGFSPPSFKLNLDLDNFIVMEDKTSYYDLPTPATGITYYYEYDFKLASSFCSGKNNRITFSPKVGDRGDYGITINYVQTGPVETV